MTKRCTCNVFLSWKSDSIQWNETLTPNYIPFKSIGIFRINPVRVCCVVHLDSIRQICAISWFIHFILSNCLLEKYWKCHVVHSIYHLPYIFHFILCSAVQPTNISHPNIVWSWIYFKSFVFFLQNVKKKQQKIDDIQYEMHLTVVSHFKTWEMRIFFFSSFNFFPSFCQFLFHYIIVQFQIAEAVSLQFFFVVVRFWFFLVVRWHCRQRNSIRLCQERKLKLKNNSLC